MKPHLKLLLVGDVMLGRHVNDRLRLESPEYPWGDLLPLFLEADWRACNLECVITDHGAPWARSPKDFHFQTDAKNVAVLSAAHMDGVSLANNHALDFNHRGMVEMIRLLDGARIGHSGAGLNRAEATQLAISQTKGLSIGLISFTDNEPAWEAGEEHPGVFYVPLEEEDSRCSELLAKIRQAAAMVDLLIVAAHWGGNWGCHPPASHTRMAHRLVMAGADVVFGHSSHVCRGVEVFENALILYSTGDFVDDYAVDLVERNDRSFAFEIHVEDKRITHLHLHPTIIRDCQASQPDLNEARLMNGEMQQLCASLGTMAEISESGDKLVIQLEPHAGINLEPASKDWFDDEHTPTRPMIGATRQVVDFKNGDPDTGIFAGSL
jgi:poly-gamma-glutamate synthesis protein (capsule biosynthesis protein)